MKPVRFVFLSTTDWDSPQFGSRHALAAGLGARGHQVLFVEVPRALHSLVSDPQGTRRALGRLGRTRPAAPGVLAYTPWPVLPIYYSPLTNAVNQRLIAADVRHVLARLGRHTDVLWTCWPNSAPIIGRLGERVALYHAADDMAAAHYPLVSAATIRQMERRLCLAVDVILTRTPEMAAARRALNPNTVLLAGGIDTALFDPARAWPQPTALAGIGSPRVLFVGTLADHVDYELLAACATALPRVQFVIVGPVKAHRAALGLIEGLSA